MASRLDHATQSLISRKRSKSNHEISDDSVTSSNAPNALGSEFVGWSKTKNNIRSSQPLISALMENLVQSGIRGNNKSQFQRAVDDLFHSENIQDRAVESHQFATLFYMTQPVCNYSKCPNRRHVGGELLDHN